MRTLILDALVTIERDFATVRFSSFADAAFLGKYSTIFIVTQRMSPERTLKLAMRGWVRTVFSPQPQPTIEEQDKAEFYWCSYCSRGYCLCPRHWTFGDAEEFTELVVKC